MPLPVDLEAALRRLEIPVTALLFDSDWLAPLGSMRHLLSKMPAAESTLHILSSRELGAAANHFAWMQHPTAVVDAMLPHALRKISQKR